MLMHFRTEAELAEAGTPTWAEDLRDGDARASAPSSGSTDEVFHTYSTFGRGIEEFHNGIPLPRPHRARPPGGMGGTEGPRRPPRPAGRRPQHAPPRRIRQLSQHDVRRTERRVGHDVPRTSGRTDERRGWSPTAGRCGSSRGRQCVVRTRRRLGPRTSPGPDGCPEWVDRVELLAQRVQPACRRSKSLNPIAAPASDGSGVATPRSAGSMCQRSAPTLRPCAPS